MGDTRASTPRPEVAPPDVGRLGTVPERTAPTPGPEAPAPEPAPLVGPGRTRTSAAWGGLIAASLVLVLLLVFILQNLGSVRITYFTASGSFPLGAALLLAAVGGVLLAGLVASLRIVQIRRRMRRNVGGARQRRRPGGGS